MLTKIQLVISSICKKIAKLYLKLETELISTAIKESEPTTIDGIAKQDWKNVGNDLKKGILTYDKSQIK